LNQTPMMNAATQVPPKKCPPHAWKRLPDSNAPEDRIQKLENDTGNTGNQYNACVARKYQMQGKKIDVSLRFRCDACGEYQEVDLEVDGEIKETKAGNQSADQYQTRNDVDISQVLYNNAEVEILYETLKRATRDASHVVKWGNKQGGTVKARHEPCP
jgi:hypothetical protein